MGAWDELFDFFTDHQARHLSTGAPPIHARTIVHTLLLALQLANSPHLRTLHAPDAKEYYRLESRLKDLVGITVWDEAERLMKTGEYYRPALLMSDEYGPEMILASE